MEAIADQALLILAGPTASGKSGLALEIADFFASKGRSAEILCADSITVYRGFDIGSAKPSTEERAQIPHHLLDIVDPADPYTAGDFIQHAQPIIQNLHAKGKIPIVVGGTGFYLRALLWGMASDTPEDPQKNAAIKARLDERAQQEGWSALYQEILSKDPQASATIHPHDHYRIQRALHAMELYGKSWSELNKEARSAPPKFPSMRYFCLHWERDILRKRITERTQKLLASGMIEEVQSLLRAGVEPTAKPMQSVGYKECVEYLQGKISQPELLPRIVQETMRLAKSQGTWFRSERSVEILPPPFLPNLKKSLMLE